MRPFVVLALNVAIGSLGLWVGGFAGGCILAALVVADCMAVIAEGRAWAREDAADTVYDWSTDERYDPDTRRSYAQGHGRDGSLRQGVAGGERDGLALEAAASQSGRPVAQAVARPFGGGREGRAG